MLKETRKFGLFITLAAQDINDLGLEIRPTILTNVGSFLIGRNNEVGAEAMTKEQFTFRADDIRNLPDLHFYQTDMERLPIRMKIGVIGDKHALRGHARGDLISKQAELCYQSETGNSVDDDMDRQLKGIENRNSQSQMCRENWI